MLVHRLSGTRRLDEVSTLIGAISHAADTAQYEPELRNVKKGRFEERDVGLGIDA